MPNVARTPVILSPWSLAKPERDLRMVRAVYLVEAVTAEGAPLGLKLGQSEQLTTRRSQLQKSVRTDFGDPDASAHFLAYTLREGASQTYALEAELLGECGHRWKRRVPSEWFEWSESMRAEMQQRLLRDRGKWLKAWQAHQEACVAAGQPIVAITANRGVTLRY